MLGSVEVILLDIVLTRRSGVSLLRALHASEASHRVRVVMMTARSTAYDKDLVSGLGAYDDLSKPRDVFSLLDRVTGRPGRDPPPAPAAAGGDGRPAGRVRGPGAP